MKKIISVSLSFIFCFAGMSKQVLAGSGDPLVEHGDLIDNFRKNEKCALKDRQPKPDIGIPVSFIREPGFVESTWGSEYREISLYNVPDLLDQGCDEKSNKSNIKGFLIEFSNALGKLIESMDKLQKLAEENRNDLNGFFNGAANILKGVVGEKLGELMGVPEKLINMALTHAVLFVVNKCGGSSSKTVSIILQTLGIVSYAAGSYLIGNALYGWAFGKAATAVKAVGDTKEAIEKAKKAAEAAEAARKAGLLNKFWWGAGALGVGYGSIWAGEKILTKENSIEQKLVREQILNYSNFFKLLMEEITENKEKIMQSNLMLVAIDKRNFSKDLYWNEHRKNHGVWLSFETIKDLKCSPCANVCKTKDGYTMEKYIEEVTALLKGVDYKKYLIEFEEPKDNEIENGMEKEEKENDVDKESMCVCF